VSYPLAPTAKEPVAVVAPEAFDHVVNHGSADPVAK
jgi:hypothetical protein